MILLIFFAFLAGVVTVLSPCILPLLPIILGSGTTGDKKRPLGIIVGFIGSFTFFTLFLSSIVTFSGISAEYVRYFSIVTIILFGISLLVPKVQEFLEGLFSKFSSGTNTNRSGFIGGVIIGLSLGLLWTPCVGPILASVISLALTGEVTTSAFFITLAYSAGTAIPMFFIMQTGRVLFTKVPWLLRNTGNIQKGFGVVMIFVAMGMFFNIDRQFQTWVITTFPQYGSGLTKFEEQDAVKENLDMVSGNSAKEPQRQISNDALINKALPILGRAPEIIAGGEWINSVPLSLKELKGQVVLIDFWTYTCINCIRTLPYVERWQETYKDKGFTVIGVHSPEFEFEKSLKNVQKAAKDFKLTYPIVQDNNFATWKAYENRYWPAHYLVDKDGNIRYTHFGEGKYEETEKAIQDLLKEKGEEVSIAPQKQDYTINAFTREIYLGSARAEGVRLGTLEGKASAQIPNDSVYLSGNWQQTPEYATGKKGDILYLNYNATNVFIVAKSKNGELTKVKVTAEGGVVAEGVVGGELSITSDKLYQIIQNTKAQRGVVSIELLNDDIEFYAFTFG
jgi:cytochrome c biogenesis protein CcdA/thiol-disulfide isomerase/thioredoxin